MNTLQDFINVNDTADQGIKDIKDLVKQSQKVYAELTRMQDLKREHDRSGRNEIEHIVHTVEQNNAKIIKLTKKLEIIDNNIQDRVNAGEQSNMMIQYIKILHKHKINLYYFLKGSIQGVMCSRICKAKGDLVILVKKHNYHAGCLWEMYFNNLCYLYQMMKYKHIKSWRSYDIATMKHAYIDFYYQLNIIVKCWRQKGNIGVKAHYLCHDLEHCWDARHSSAWSNEERFENCNKHCKTVRRIFDKCTQTNVDMLVSNRLNTRALTCG